MTTKIMIIRHGEKPGVPVAADGIDADGNDDPESLTAAGWHRAHALVELFHPAVPQNIKQGLAVPDVLFAAAERGGGSKRPVETITPLAESFEPPKQIQDAITSTDVQAIARACTAVAGNALVCWKHENILDIAKQLVRSSSVLPKRWPGSRFDMVWVFDLAADGTYEFSQVPELVLPTDLSIPMR